jgi:hypothetical protein
VKNNPQPIVAQVVATTSHIINAGAVLLAKRNFSRKVPEEEEIFNLCILLQVLSSLMDRSAASFIQEHVTLARSRQRGTLPDAPHQPASGLGQQREFQVPERLFHPEILEEYYLR